ncbi:putative ubiquitin conjugating enzyme, partial [Thozetella sp. PMI_491]
ALKRIKRELRDVTSYPPEDLSYYVLPIADDLFDCEAVILGPVRTCYHGGLFFLTVQFPQDYPFKKPLIRFKTPIFHANITETGIVSLDILRDQWSPALTVNKCLLAIVNLLSDPTGPYGFPGRVDLLENDPAKYFATVREWTRKYAL